jgi:hypothetical protein
MAEKQPSTVVEGATTADVEDELPHAATSAEDRRAAAALSSLDARADEGARADVDRDAVRRAMDRLAGAGNAGEEKTVQAARQEVRRVVKVDQEDVRLLVGFRAACGLLAAMMLTVAVGGGAGAVEG